VVLQTKTLADTLTGARFLLGLYLVWLGMHSGPRGMATATLTLLVAWVTDVLDGPLARRDPRRRHTWVGDHDLEADLAVGLGVWSYLALAQFIPHLVALAYVAIAVAALLRIGTAPLAWGLQALPYGAMIWTAWRVVSPLGWVLVLWIGVVLVATWPRFPKQMLPEFLAGMASLLKRD
jgi:cardiolipin synthase